MVMKEIYALGVGHATPVFIELAEACGYKVVGLYHYNDTRTGELDHGFPILGSFDDLLNSDIKGRCFVLTMISRFATVSQSGVLICSYSEVHSDSIIEQGCVLWPKVIIGHDCQIHDYIFFGPNAYVGAYTEIERKAFIGQCSVLISDKAKHIGKNTLIGAGSLVTKPISDNSVAAGSPAVVVGQR